MLILERQANAAAMGKNPASAAGRERRRKKGRPEAIASSLAARPRGTLHDSWLKKYASSGLPIQHECAGDQGGPDRRGF
jgi:hypothetical protein